MLYSKPIKNSWKIHEKWWFIRAASKNYSNLVIKKVTRITKGKIILIGVGGVSSGRDDEFEKISLGVT